MATNTRYYNLSKPENSDLVSPAAYNANFDIIDNELHTIASVGRIDSEGTHTDPSTGVIWKWRRWTGGMAECWIEKWANTIIFTNTWGNSGLYYGDCCGAGNYPIVFINQPTVTATLLDSRGSGRAFPIWPMPTGTTTACPGFRALDPTSGTVDFYLGVYVIGRWK